MPYLPNIIKKIDDFYRLASSFNKSAAGPVVKEYTPVPGFSKKYEGYDPYANEPEGEEATSEETKPELEPEARLYNEIIDSLDEFDSKDIANEVYVIAEEYKKASEIKAGFSKVLEDIKKAKTSLEELLKEFGAYARREISIAQSFINDMEKSVQQMVASSPPPQAANEAAARQAVNNAKKDAFGAIGNQESAGQASKFERGNKDGLTSGTVGPQQTVSVRREKYESDIVALTKALEDPSIPDNDKRNIPIIIELNKKILNQMDDLKGVEDHLSTIPDDPQAQQAVEKERAALEDLRKQREKVQNLLREFNQTQRVQEWITKANASTNLKEKMWYELNGQLAQIRLLRTVNKTPAVEAVKDLIGELGELNSRGDFISKEVQPQRLQELKDKFDDAKKQMISKVRYDAEQSKQRALTHGKVGPHFERRKGRRGGGSPRSRINQYDIGQATFNGLVDKLGEKINTATHVARLEVTQINEKGRAKTHNALKPFVDNLSKAIQNIVKNSKDPAKLAKAQQEKYEAIKVLKQQLTDWSSKEPAIRVLEKNVRLLPFFKKYEAELNEIAGWKKEGQAWDLDEAKAAKIKSLLSNFDNLLRIYGRYYQGIGAPKGKSQLDLNFNNAIVYIATVLNRLEHETNIYAAREEEPSGMRVESPTETESPAGMRVETPKSEPQGVRVEESEDSEEEALNENEELQKLIEEQNVERKRDKKFMTSSSLKARMLIIAGINDKIEYDRRQSMEKAREQGKFDYVEREKGRRGGGTPGAKIHQYDFDQTSFDGLVTRLAEKINTATNTARQEVTQIREMGRAKTHNALKPYVDALSKAIQKNNKEAKYQAIRELKAQLADWATKSEAVRVLEKNVRLAPHFNKIKNDFITISKYVNSDNEIKLTPARDFFIMDTISNALRLISICDRYYHKPGKTNIGYVAAVDFLSQATARLEQMRKESKHRFEHGFQGK